MCEYNISKLMITKSFIKKTNWLTFNKYFRGTYREYSVSKVGKNGSCILGFHNHGKSPLLLTSKYNHPSTTEKQNLFSLLKNGRRIYKVWISTHVSHKHSSFFDPRAVKKDIDLTPSYVMSFKSISKFDNTFTGKNFISS